MKINDQLSSAIKISIPNTKKRNLFVKRQLQNIISRLENADDESDFSFVPHVDFYKKHRTHRFPRFENL